MTETTPATRLLTVAALAADLTDWAPLAEATGEPMQAASLTLWAHGDQEVGVWECTPGPSYWVQEMHEFIHVVSGRMTVTPDGGDPTDIGPGDTAVFPRGWRGSWQIHEQLRKIYVVF